MGTKVGKGAKGVVTPDRRKGRTPASLAPPADRDGSRPRRCIGGISIRIDQTGTQALGSAPIAGHRRRERGCRRVVRGSTRRARRRDRVRERDRAGPGARGEGEIPRHILAGEADMPGVAGLTPAGGARGLGALSSRGRPGDGRGHAAPGRARRRLPPRVPNGRVPRARCERGGGEVGGGGAVRQGRGPRQAEGPGGATRLHAQEESRARRRARAGVRSAPRRVRRGGQRANRAAGRARRRPRRGRHERRRRRRRRRLRVWIRHPVRRARPRSSSGLLLLPFLLLRAGGGCVDV